MRHRQLLAKTWLGCIVVISCNVIANYALARGLHATDIESFSPLPYFRAMLHPWTALGVIFMIGWFTSRLAVLSWTDLSYILPVNSLSFLLSAVVGALILNEDVSRLHWTGIVIITLGVLLVALTDPETDGELEHKR